jgi:hypothetical protein
MVPPLLGERMTSWKIPADLRRKGLTPYHGTVFTLFLFDDGWHPIQEAFPWKISNLMARDAW